MFWIYLLLLCVPGGVLYFLVTMSFGVVSLVAVSECTAVICGSLPV